MGGLLVAEDCRILMILNFKKGLPICISGGKIILGEKYFWERVFELKIGNFKIFIDRNSCLPKYFAWIFCRMTFNGSDDLGSDDFCVR